MIGDRFFRSDLPGRLVLRRRLLLWSTPVLVLMLLFAAKLASVGVLGNRLPEQFADRDRAGMESTLSKLGIGSIGPGYRELLALGDATMLGGQLQTAHDHFRAAHGKEPGACPPRGNFAITSEVISDSYVKEGKFFQARTLLEEAVAAAEGDTGCFATFSSPNVEVQAHVADTPERLSDKLTALKGGFLTETADGFDYLRTPGGGIDFGDPGADPPCPLDSDDDAALADCVRDQDAERAAKVAEAERAAAAERDAAPPPPTAPPAPGAAPPPPPPAPGQPVIAPEPAPGEQTVEFPGELEEVQKGEPWFCTPDGQPLGDLSAEMCKTAGPLP